MSLKDRTDRVAERIGANEKPACIIFAKDNETSEQAWARCHPSTPMPSPDDAQIIVVMWIGNEIAARNGLVVA